MKNMQVFDDAKNAVYDIFEITDEAFDLIFPGGTDIAFIEEVLSRLTDPQARDLFEALWKRRIPKRNAMGIHGQIFYRMSYKTAFYPTHRDEEAINPDGSLLR